MMRLRLRLRATMSAEAEAEREALTLCQSLTCTAGYGVRQSNEQNHGQQKNMEEANAGRQPEAVAWHALTWRSENSCMRACATLTFA